MANLNKVMIIGRVGTEPEMRYTPNGNPVTRFRIATNRVYTGTDGERKQETEWFTVVAWNKLAETCNAGLNKGGRAYVEGRLRTRTWEGQDGQKRTQVEIVAERILFIDRQQVAPLTTDEAKGEESKTDEEIEAEDLPF